MRKASKRKRYKTFVYIDGANLHQWSKPRGGIDYRKFKIWLAEKYKTQTIYLFMGYVKGHEALYSQLSEWWYILIFKETLEVEGKVKGNCDAELVVKAVSNFYEEQSTRAILVTSDGDFACLVDFFKEKKHEVILLAPSKTYCSFLLKKRNIPIVFLEEVNKRFSADSQAS